VQKQTVRLLELFVKVNSVPSGEIVSSLTRNVRLRVPVNQFRL